MPIKLKDDEECKLSFDHIRDGQPASLYVARNPLTNDWIQVHKHDGKETAYVGNKQDALRLINLIINKSKVNNKSCKVTVQSRTVLPNK